MDFVIPHDGQGKPVVAFSGQKDCSLSNDWLLFWSHKKKGITSVKIAPVIPKILFKINFLIV